LVLNKFLGKMSYNLISYEELDSCCIFNAL